MSSDANIPARNLQGLVIGSGWQVDQLVTKSSTATGGCFSSGYLVSKGENKAFLKAFDFSSAFMSSDIIRSLQQQTEAYNFERDLLEKCKTNHLSKVVIPIESGNVDVPGFPPIMGKVFFIVFELADGDIRSIKEKYLKSDLAFILRSLHSVAVAVNQLHNVEIAHQDIKPSNALVFKNETKLSDLGRASASFQSFENDKRQMPGDCNYAPPEQRYGFRVYNDMNDRYAADLYSFGSLFFFYFTGFKLSYLLTRRFIDYKVPSSSSFLDDLPMYEKVFSELIIELKDKYIPVFVESEELKNEIIQIVISLCCPDPRKRGHWKNKHHGLSQFSMERYITELDLLASKVEEGSLR